MSQAQGGWASHGQWVAPSPLTTDSFVCLPQCAVQTLASPECAMI